MAKLACGEELVFIELKKGKLFQSMETIRFSKIDTRECCLVLLLTLIIYYIDNMFFI